MRHTVRTETPTTPDRTSLPTLLANSARHIRAADAALDELYGTPELQPDNDPLGGLIATILSQHTSDINSERAYRALRSHFPTWEGVCAAPRPAIAEAIRSGGLAEIKSERIQSILECIQQREGNLSLARLYTLPLAEARQALTALHGVGPKTASCVLLFHMGKPAFPVDTHVHRVSLRMGFAPAKAGPSRVQELVEASIAPDRCYPLHVNMIRHGRQVCKAQRPQCGSCGIRPLCRYGMQQVYSG